MQRRIDSHTYWPANYSYTAIGAALIINLILVVFFGTRLIAPEWLFANLGFLAFFFVIVNIVSIRAGKNTSTDYGRQIFWMAWGVRLVFMTILVIIAELTWDQPFYVGAVDAARYHRVASELSQLLAAGNFQSVFPHLAGEYLEYTDNYGVPLVLSVVYTFFGQSVIVGKVFITLMGAGTAFFAYKTAKLITDEWTSRLAGILIAFFPLSLFYSSVILKEEFVVFLSMVGIFLLTKSVVKGRVKLWEIGVLIASVSILFLFRTAAGALMVSLVVGVFFMNRIKGSVLVSLSISVLILSGFFYFIDAFGEVDYYVERISGVFDYSEARIRSIAEGNTLASIVGIPTFVILSFIAPFPSMVYLPVGNLPHDDTYYWIAGLMIWNFLIYFGLVGFWKLVKQNLSESLAVWGFAVGYTIILGVTALFTAVRFGYNAMPAFFILIAIGIKHRDEFPWWKLYLIGAVGLILAWNYFRLAGRGMM